MSDADDPRRIEITDKMAEDFIKMASFMLPNIIHMPAAIEMFYISMERTGGAAEAAYTDMAASIRIHMKAILAGDHLAMEDVSGMMTALLVAAVLENCEVTLKVKIAPDKRRAAEDIMAMDISAQEKAEKLRELKKAP